MSIQYNLNEVGKRPWGEWKCIGVGEGYIVKSICVNPGAALSLQMHNHRSEHWLVVGGCAKVTVGDKVALLEPGQSVDIPKGIRHRLENDTDEFVNVIEIQMGQILDETDIVRFGDIYNRI